MAKTISLVGILVFGGHWLSIRWQEIARDIIFFPVWRYRNSKILPGLMPGLSSIQFKNIRLVDELSKTCAVCSCPISKPEVLCLGRFHFTGHIWPHVEPVLVSLMRGGG